MIVFKFDSVRKILTSGNVWNCIKDDKKFQSWQVFVDFEVESLSGSENLKGKKGDYVIVNPNCELTVISNEDFKNTYKVINGWDIRQYATNLEDYHFGIGFWKDSPFNDEALNKLRKEKINKNTRFSSVG